jgi:hypothetical protein
MTGEQSFALRASLGALCGLATITAWPLAEKLRLSATTFSRLFLAFFALSRLGLFTIAMLILRINPRGDITLYMTEADHAPGHLVYRDFLTNHSPLDPYLLHTLLSLHHSPLTLILFSILCDVAAMGVWMQAAPHFLNPIPLRRAALLVLCNPTSLLTVAIDGQLNSLVALLLALAVYSIATRPTSRLANATTGALIALSAATVRFTTLIYAPGFLFASRRKLAALLTFLIVLIGIYAAFALAGADITTPLRLEGPHKTASNLIFLLELATGRDLHLRLPIALLALSWFAVITILFVSMKAASSNQKHTLHILTLSLIAELLCIQIFSKNAWDRYLVMTMFSLCTLAAELPFRALIAFALWTITAALEPSYWATLAHSQPSLELHLLLIAREPKALTLLSLELLYVGGSILLLIACLRRILTLRSTAAR